MTDVWTEADDAIEEVRETRRKLFAELDNDVARIGAYYEGLNEQFADRMSPAPSPSVDYRPIGVLSGCQPDEEWTEADDAIEEVWEIRRQIWAQFDNDPEKVIAYYIELDKHYTGPKIEPPSGEGRTSRQLGDTLIS